MTSLIHTYVPHLDQARPSLSRLREIGGIGIGWCLAPIVLFLTWMYFIRAHELLSSFLHAGLLVASIMLGFVSFRIAACRLKGDAWPDPLVAKSAYRPKLLHNAIVMTLGLIVTFTLSYIAIRAPSLNSTGTGDGTQASVASIMNSLDSKRFLNIENSDVSRKPQNWQDPLNGEELEHRWQRSVTTAQPERNVYQEKLTKQLLHSGVHSAELRGIDLVGSNATGTFMVLADLSNAELNDAKFEASDLRAANLSNVSGSNARFSRAKLVAAKLSRGQLHGADFTNADMRFADMLFVNNESAASEKPSISRPARLDYADLSYADLTHANLQNASLFKSLLIHADMPSANFTDASLVQANLSHAKMPDVILRNARLNEANLKDAEMQNADLSNADFRGADLTDAVMTGAIFSGATMTDAKLANADLSCANVEGTSGLTQIQLDTACGNRQTKLPAGLTIKGCIQTTSESGKCP